LQVFPSAITIQNPYKKCERLREVKQRKLSTKLKLKLLKLTVNFIWNKNVSALQNTDNKCRCFIVCRKCWQAPRKQIENFM